MALPSHPPRLDYNKQPRTDNKVWSSSLGLGVGLTTLHHKNKLVTENLILLLQFLIALKKLWRIFVMIISDTYYTCVSSCISVLSLVKQWYQLFLSPLFIVYFPGYTLPFHVYLELCQKRHKVIILFAQWEPSWSTVLIQQNSFVFCVLQETMYILFQFLEIFYEYLGH
jgi:hypothetical protein